MESKQLINMIKKMLTKGLTSSEIRQLLDEQPMTDYQFRQWEKAPQAHIEDKVASQVILDKITTRCRDKQQPSIKKSRSYYYIGSLVAASILAFISVFWISYNSSSSYITVKTPIDKRLSVVLPDSSKVWLNANSEIRYRKSFQHGRDVFLEKGEAFFKVRKAQNAPFRVRFQESQIEVTGTEFNIKSENVESEITLFSGSINFQAEQNKDKLSMKPNERIVYNANTKSMVRTSIDTNEYDWRSDKFSFIDKPLQELVDFINRTYSVNILINDKEIKEQKFNGTIRKTESLDNILDKICISMNLKQKKENQCILLY